MPSVPRRFLVRRVGAIFAALALALIAAPGAQADPVSIAQPVISGTLQVGQTLSVTRGEWSDPTSPIISYSYEWLRCEQSICLIITGATSSTYTLQNADYGQSIDAAVEATDAEGHFNGGQAQITNTITAAPGPITQSAPGVLAQPQGVEAQPAARQAAGAAPAPESDAASSSPSPVSVARLLTVHEVHRRVQAEVRCEQARPCRLSLAVFALLGGYGALQTSGPRHALIAQRSFSVGAEHSTRVSLMLTRAGARLLRAHRRLPVVAVLASSGSGADSLSESHLTMTA